MPFLRSLRIAVLACGCMSALPPDLEAQPIISSTSGWNGNTSASLLSRDFLPASVGQTFTTPSGASTLNALTVFLGYAPMYFPDDQDLRFNAYLFGWNGTTLTDLLWKSPVQNGSADLPLETRTFDVGGIPLAAGGQYAFVLSTLEADPFNPAEAFVTAFPAYQSVGFLDSDVYAGGFLLQSVASDWAELLSTPWLVEPGADLAFEMRFAAHVVPEPSTVFLLGPFVVIVLALAIRRRTNDPTIH